MVFCECFSTYHWSSGDFSTHFMMPSFSVSDKPIHTLSLMNEDMCLCAHKSSGVWTSSYIMTLSLIIWNFLIHKFGFLFCSLTFSPLYGGREVKNKSRFWKQNKKLQTQTQKTQNKITSQKTLRQIRQTGKGRYSLRQRHWFVNRLLAADWTRHLSIKMNRKNQNKNNSPIVYQRSGADGKIVCHFAFLKRLTWVQFRFCQTLFLPFQISYHIVKAFIFNRN